LCSVSFDGRNVHNLRPGDSVRMYIGQWPLAMITAETMDQDWFVSITEKLMWNSVIKQHNKPPLKPLPVPALYAP
jgi:NAD kinase